MRGRSGAYLIQASDGRHYVAKFSGNPKGTRTLINELLGSLILGALGLPVAEGAVLRLDEAALPGGSWPMVGSPEDRCRAEAGLHFGSAYPGECGTDVVYDFLPRNLYHLVSNRDVFGYALLADRLLGRSEFRQAVFTRNAERNFTATFVDNSMLFGGSDWSFDANVEQAQYFDRAVYGETKVLSPTKELLSQVGDLLSLRRMEVLQSIPGEWLRGDEPALNALLDELVERAKRLSADQAQSGPPPGVDSLGAVSTTITTPTGPTTSAPMALQHRKPVQSESAVGGESSASASLSASCAIEAAS